MLLCGCPYLGLAGRPSWPTDSGHSATWSQQSSFLQPNEDLAHAGRGGDFFLELLCYKRPCLFPRSVVRAGPLRSRNLLLLPGGLPRRLLTFRCPFPVLIARGRSDPSLTNHQKRWLSLRLHNYAVGCGWMQNLNCRGLTAIRSLGWLQSLGPLWNLGPPLRLNMFWHRGLDPP